MKKAIYLTTVLFFPQLLFATNFYWVGGSGTWSDYAHHWAIASGSTVFHVTIPNPTDDVFFDANSFAAGGDTVYLDTTITNCRTMDWSGATNSPDFFSGGANLQIYGSMALNATMHWDIEGT